MRSAITIITVIIIAVPMKFGLYSLCEVGSNTIHATDVEGKSSVDHNQKADLDPIPSLVKALKHKTILLPFNIFERILCFSVVKSATVLPRTLPLYPHHTCSHTCTHTHITTLCHLW